MNRAIVLVEGQTEEAFVGRVMQPHLWGVGVDLQPKIVVTRRVRTSSPDHKGGVSSWQQILRDIRLLLGDTNAVGITTLIDYYGLPSDVPGMSSRPAGGPASAKVGHVEAKVEASVADPRFKAYLAQHEFEAMLFAEPDTCGNYLSSPELATAMQAAVSACGGPEEVNDDPQTAPSKRIISALPTFQKTAHGPAIAERIGIASIRAACAHFDEWVSWLEGLAP